MRVLRESQSSDLLEESECLPLNPCINGEINSPNDPYSYTFTELETKQVLDLLLFPASPNRVARHFSQALRRYISPWKIKQLLLSFKPKIDALNERFDKIAGRKVVIIQIDETFKGQKVSILVVIDAITGYIFHLKWVDQRTEVMISTQLKPLRELLHNAKVIMTDGAPYFPEVAKKLCPSAIHQKCLVHVLRGIYPYLQPYKTSHQQHLRKFHTKRKAIISVKEKIKEKRYMRKKLKQKLKYWKQKRNKVRKKYHVVPYQKGILERYPKLKKMNKKINVVRAQLRSLNKTLANLDKKEIKLKTQKGQAFQDKNHAWGIYMAKCRTLHQFYRLFNLKGETYENERRKFVANLKKKKKENCELIQELLRLILKTRNLDTVNHADSPVQLDYHYINTNAIENVNSLIRPYLECLRKITDSHYIDTFFSVLRFYLNTRNPFSGPRSDTCPIERYGYDLRGRNYLDILQDGLPRGPQAGLFMQKIDLAMAAPNLSQHCKI